MIPINFGEPKPSNDGGIPFEKVSIEDAAKTPSPAVAMSEIQEANNLENEKLKERIASIKSFKDLFDMLNEIPGIQGSSEFHDSNSIKIKLESFLAGNEQNLNRFTSSGGLREKIGFLMREEVQRYIDFSEEVLKVNEKLRLHYDPSKPDDVYSMNREISRNSICAEERKNYAIYYNGGLFGVVTGPTSVQDFRNKLQALYDKESKTPHWAGIISSNS